MRGFYGVINSVSHHVATHLEFDVDSAQGGAGVHLMPIAILSPEPL